MSTNSESFKRNLHSVGILIGGTVPQFFKDDKELKCLIRDVEDLRVRISVKEGGDDLVLVLNGFVGALRSVL